MYKSGCQGVEQFVVMRLPRGGQRGQRSAVEAVFEGDDSAVFRAFFVLRIFAGDLDGAFVGFGTGIAEEHFFHACLFAQKLCKLCTGLGVIQIGCVLHLAELLCHGFQPCFVALPEACDGNARTHVDVFLAVGINQYRAFARNDLHGETGIGVGNILLVKCL